MKTVIQKAISGSFFRFVLVGGVSALIEYLLYFLFKPFLGYLPGNVAAFACTNVLTYILSSRYVFSSTNANKAQEATLYTVFLMGALAVNQGVLWGLVEYIALDDKIAKAVAISVAVIWNFFTRKHFVFRNREVVAEVATEPVATSTTVKEF